MEVLKNNAKSIAITAGVAALTIAGLYSIYKRVLSKPKSTHSETLPILTEEQKDTIIKNIKVTYNGQMLSVDTVLDMAMALSKFSTAAFVNLENENTKARRANKDNLIQYARICKESITAQEFAIARATTEIHDRLGVSGDLWERSFQYYLQQGNPKVLNIDATFAQAESETFPQKPLREISKEDVIKMMVKMIEGYKAELVNIPVLNEELKDPELTGIIITYRATDPVYEEFKVKAKEFQLALKKHISQFGVEEKRICQEFLLVKQKLK